MKIACCGLLCSVFLKAKMFRHKLWYPNPLKAPKKSAFSVLSVLPYVSMAAPLRLEKSRFFMRFEFYEFFK